MSDLLYFTKSLKLRAEAAEALRRARQLPRGCADRSALRQIARSLRALAATEAWLDGNLSRNREAKTTVSPRGVERLSRLSD